MTLMKLTPFWAISIGIEMLHYSISATQTSSIKILFEKEVPRLPFGIISPLARPKTIKQDLRKSLTSKA